MHRDSPENLSALLGSLHVAWEHSQARFKDLDLRIEVIDSGSLPVAADAAVKVLEKEKVIWSERVGYHRLPVHRGYARAQNELLKRAPAKGYVLFLHADLALNPDALVTIRYYLRRSIEKRRLFCPVMMGNRLPRLGAVLRRWQARALPLRPDEPKIKPDVAGRVFLAPARLFRADGAWNEAYSDGCEELELAYRLGKKGWRVEPMKEVVIVEKTAPRGYAALAERKERLARGRGRFLLDAWPRVWSWAPRALVALEIAGEILLSVARGRWPEASGLWRGLTSWYRQKGA